MKRNIWLAAVFSHSVCVISRISNCLNDATLKSWLRYVHFDMFHDSSRARFFFFDLSSETLSLCLSFFLFLLFLSLEREKSPFFCLCRRIAVWKTVKKRGRRAKKREIRAIITSHDNLCVDTCATRTGGKRNNKTSTHAPILFLSHVHTCKHIYIYHTRTKYVYIILEMKMEKTRWRWSLANADAIRGKKKKQLLVVRAERKKK